MLVDCANHKAKLFYSIRKPYNHEDRTVFAQLVSLLNFIEVLEKKGLIYLQPSNAGCELFFYENFKHNFLHGIQKNCNVKETISQQEQIIYDTDEYEVLDVQGVKMPKIKSDFLFITKDGTRIMQSTDVSSLYNRIYRLLCSRAFPTSALSRFIDNGYCLDEEKRSINSLRYAKASLFIAMLALLVSMPCISVWYSNQHAYSTIDTVQYNTLIKKLNAIEKNGKATDINFKQKENCNINSKNKTFLMTNQTSENNKRIAKNTLLLYVRMFFMMGIALYTSRVVLNTLGVEDYGIYNVVGGLVSMFGLLNGSMSSATQRYITFELGKGDGKSLNKIFSLSLQIHALIAIVTVLLIESVGLWFLYNKMTIPPERMTAAFWVLQASALTFIFSIMSVPYNADIIAHERMSAFAYISIIEAVLKLVIVYMLLAVPFDKLIVYAILLALVQLSIQLCYMVYCHRHFPESRYRHVKDWRLFKEMTSFAGWNLFGGLSSISFNQGLSMLLNVFFGPVVNAARAVATQVQGAIQMFITNFQMALNPQIVKTYAQGDFESMHTLMFRSSRFSFFLMYLLSLPVLLEAPLILQIWLKTVPDNTVIFLRLIICTTLIYTIINPILVANNATGKVRTYYIVCGSMMISILPISYIVLRMGCPAYSVFIVHFCIELLTQVARLIMVRDRLKLSIRKYILKVYLPIVMVTIIAAIIPLLVYNSMTEGLVKFFIVSIVSVMSVALTSFIIGFSDSERQFFINKFKLISAKIRI